MDDMTSGPIVNDNNVIDYQVEDIYDFIPLRDRAIGRMTKDARAETTLASGIIVTNSVKEPWSEFEIIKVGSGVVTANGVVPVEVKVGDTVLVWTGKWFELKDAKNTYVIFQENDIVCIKNKKTL